MKIIYTVNEVRIEFKKYLSQKYPNWSSNSISTIYSDAFYAYNNNIVVPFWDCLTNDNSMNLAKEKIEQHLLTEVKSNNAKERAIGYLSALKHLKDFVNDTYGGIENIINSEMYSKHIENSKKSDASFLKWFSPVIEALKKIGGSGTPQEVRAQIIKDFNLSADVINATRGKNKTNKFNNEVAWARNYLTYEGYIDKSTRGIWALTQKGKSEIITEDIASDIFLKWVNILKTRRDENEDDNSTETKYWIYAPGEKSSKWDEFYKEGIMGLGWDELMDLTQYPSKESMKLEMKNIYGEEKSYMNDSHAS